MHVQDLGCPSSKNWRPRTTFGRFSTILRNWTATNGKYLRNKAWYRKLEIETYKESHTVSQNFINFDLQTAIIEPSYLYPPYVNGAFWFLPAVAHAKVSESDLTKLRQIVGAKSA